jgi:hypothetical protein
MSVTAVKIFTEIAVRPQILIKLSVVKFHENPISGLELLKARSWMNTATTISAQQARRRA